MDHKLSETEQYLQNFIKHHILEIPNYSIMKLSEQANASTTIIVWIMKKRGYGGFTSFKHHLKEGENKNINFSFLDKIDKGIRRAILKNGQEVVRMVNMLEIGDTEDVMQRIKLVDRASVFARGFSEITDQEMFVKLQLTGKSCQMHIDPEIIKSISRKLTKRDSVIFVSLSGETKELVTAAKNCYDVEIGSILVTANHSSTLKDYYEINLVGFKSEGSYPPDYGVRSRPSLRIIARILLDAYALCMGENWKTVYYG